MQSVDKYLVPASLYLSDNKSWFPGCTKRHVSLWEHTALIPVMAERLWQTDSINQTAAERELCCECGNVTQSLAEFFVFGAVHMIMASIKSSWCWTFYPPPRQMHRHRPLPTKPNSFVSIICKIFPVLKIQFDLRKDESGKEMRSLEFISLQPATWTSKLQRVATIMANRGLAGEYWGRRWWNKDTF